MRTRRLAALCLSQTSRAVSQHQQGSSGNAKKDNGSHDRNTENRSATAPAVADEEAWVSGHVDRALAAGRQTPEAAAYFQDILHDKPEFADCLREARRLTGGQDPSQFTPYQQGLFADRLGAYLSGIAAQKLMQVQQEEHQGKAFTKDGTPTGEQYWYEAGSTLSSPAVPGYVKDKIFHDMQKDRQFDSPAFEESPDAQRLADEDEGFAAHMRRQKKQLLSGVDFGSPKKSQ